MSIFVNSETKVIYQGLTGSQGKYYGLLNRDYGKMSQEDMRLEVRSYTLNKYFQNQRPTLLKM